MSSPAPPGSTGSSAAPYWLAALALAYVGAAAAQQASDGLRSAIGLAFVGLGPLALAVVYRVTSEAPPSAARAAARATAFGALAWVASRLAPGRPLIAALGAVGCAIASTGSLLGLGQFPGLGGLASVGASRIGIEAAAFASLPWSVAVVLQAADAAGLPVGPSIHPDAGSLATTTAALASLGVGIVLVGRLFATRRHELGARDRGTAALVAVVAAALTGVAASAIGLAPPDEALSAAAASAGCAVAASSLASDPARLLQRIGDASAVLVALLPVAAGAVVGARLAPDRAPELGALAALAGSGATLAALRWRRRSGEGGRARLEEAMRACLEPEPEVALASALEALAAVFGDVERTRPKTTLFVFDPPESATVGRTGHLERRTIRLPQELLALAADEPERVLRAEVLRSVAVRRPDVRGPLITLEQRGIELLALLGPVDSLVGALALPRPERALGLAEVRSLRLVADRLSAIAEGTASLARAQRREAAALETVRSLEAETKTLTDENARGLLHGRALADALARPIALGSYSPAARACLRAIEDLAKSGRPFTLVRSVGTDALAWAAWAHRQTAGTAFVVVHGRDQTEAKDALASWKSEETSPLLAARGGTLVLLEPEALPMAVQRFLASSPLSGARLLVVAVRAPGSLAADGLLDHALAERLGDLAVVLPSLADRGEDVRPLALEHLREVASSLGAPSMGLALRAQRLLVERDWPAGEVELRAVVLRAALAAWERGETVVGASDVLAALRG